MASQVILTTKHPGIVKSLENVSAQEKSTPICNELLEMKCPLSEEHHSAGAVTLDGQSDPQLFGAYEVRDRTFNPKIVLNFEALV